MVTQMLVLVLVEASSDERVVGRMDGRSFSELSPQDEWAFKALMVSADKMMSVRTPRLRKHEV